jgi:phosphate transport system permease protein
MKTAHASHTPTFRRRSGKFADLSHAYLLYWNRHPFSALVRLLCFLCTGITVFALLDIVADILIKGLPNMTPELFSLNYTTDNQSLLPSLINTFIITAISLCVAVPLGVGGAIYLSEYAHRNSMLVRAVRLTAETLAGIPSIIYGLFGMMFFVISLNIGLSLLAGALTLSLMVLPVILRTTEEALLSVPNGYREGSYGLGAGKLRTVWRIVLPPASPGILAGIVLSVGRIVGETAALLFTAGTLARLPDGLLSSGRTLSVHMYVLAGEGLHIGEAYATAAVLLVFVIVMNSLSGLISRRIIKE